MTCKDPSDLNIRLDQLLYYLRIFKTRGMATKAIEKGSCKVNNFLIKKKNKFIEIKAEGKDPETISADIIGAIEDRG